MATEVHTNLRVIKRSRTQPQEGDLFVMQLPDERYLFGQVVGADLPRDRAPTPSAYLIYVYNQTSDRKTPDLDRLTPDRLLLPPLFINRMPWTKGYFQNVAHRQLGPEHLLRQHCFWSATFSCYVDDRRQRLPKRIEPCGMFALNSYRSLDDEISDALGIPRVPYDD